jgi:hypothetical protein
MLVSYCLNIQRELISSGMWRIWRPGEFLSTDFLIKETCPRGKMKGDKSTRRKREKDKDCKEERVREKK